ncbi:unnamed protein product [Mytilus coruscus]|uniref:Uncharacterized protein n=1 Tax=Mytilus coruscus TaxID=42192 RepID=A0A6J8EFF4_MYTCO|nr:unnamed protein product [Mytilus coruscus]
MPVCIVLEPAGKESVDHSYSISRYTLPIFRFEKGSTGYATWSTAISVCLGKNESLSKNVVHFPYNGDYWLPYFKYKEDKANEQCVSIVMNDNSLPLTYQFRPCSGRLPVLCKDKILNIYIQRRKLMKVHFTSLTPRRDENNYNEIPYQISDTITGQYYEVVPLSEITASGCSSTVQQNIDQIKHIDTAGYPIPSSILERREGHYETIAE